MLKKIVFTTLFVIMSYFGHAQKNLNDYKYIIIPQQFEFSKSDDQFQLNSLTKFLFNKYGYEAYFIDELPEDLKLNRCLGLIAEASNDEGNLFKTKVEITLKDCYGAIISKSQIGESRVKDYNKAYNEAIREAFETYKNMDYKYDPKESAKSKSEEEQPLSTSVEVKEKSEIIVTKAKPVEENTETEILTDNETKPELYYAQAIINGFQLVNSEPKVVMILLNTQAEDVFIVKDKNAIVFNKDGQWVYSRNEGTSLEVRILDIKF